MKIYSLLLLMTCLSVGGAQAACTNEFAPVCGYWMHTPKTQTFQNKCQMLAAGAKHRHDGSCKDLPANQAPHAAISFKK